MTARSQKNFFTRYTGVRKQAERAVERIENFIVCPLFAPFWNFCKRKTPETPHLRAIPGKGSKLSRGLEPPTSALPRRRATDCAKTAYCVPAERKIKYTLLEFDCQVKADLNPAKW